MLAWARKWRGRTVEEAAARVGKTPAELAEWESKSSDPDAKRPTVRQARDLADFYERSFLEFFRDAPPTLHESELVPDFRMEKGVASDVRELKAIQEWAEEKRTDALDLFEELGEEPPNVPEELFAHANSHEIAAENARRALDFDILEQFAIKSKERNQFPDLIRQKLERAGILVLRRSDMLEYGARGICIDFDILPTLVYASEAPGAQAFTLAHELGHVIKKQSAISGPRQRDNPFDIERWCDQFSAAFLMPRDAMRGVLGHPPNDPAPNFGDQELSRIANKFRVSQHAMMIRLVHLGYVDPNFYWGVKKPLFDAIDAKIRFGRPRYYGSRYKSSVGNLYTGLVLEAWSSGRITNHNAAEYMGIKNFEHLYDIRNHFHSQ